MTIFEAVKTGNIDALIALMERDGKQVLETKDERGFTPLILASYNNRAEATHWLIENGVDINGRDAALNTALIGVSFKGHTDVAALILSHGPDVNAQNHQGATALIYACAFGNEEIVEMLLSNGADTTIKDGSGLSAMDHAVKGGSEKIQLLLKQYSQEKGVHHQKSKQSDKG
jgi:ankyrin repeat protein